MLIVFNLILLKLGIENFRLFCKKKKKIFSWKIIVFIIDFLFLILKDVS